MSIKEIAELKIGVLSCLVILALFAMQQFILLVEHIRWTVEEIVFVLGIQHWF